MNARLNTALKTLVVLILIAGITALLPRPLQAQTGRGRERLKGIVVDQDDKPIAGATVSLMLKGTYRMNMKTRKSKFEPVSAANSPVKKEIQTNAKGQFRFIGLSFGQWEVTAAFGDLVPDTKVFALGNEQRTQDLKLKLKKRSEDKSSTPFDFDKALAGGATEALDEETKKALKNPKKLYELGEQFLLSDELENAIRCFHLAAKRKPGWHSLYLKMGYAYFNLGNDKKALENFKKFLELAPKAPEALTVKEMVEILKEEE
ncbi:MAG: tetratricopeptide repeat protein [bacterium]|nr:tetratricopeptide repeat protein [bacterium]